MLLSLDEKFDTHLAQAENLTSLFIAIYDGVSQFISFLFIYCVCVSFDMNLFPYWSRRASAWAARAMYFGHRYYIRMHCKK